MKHFLLHTKNTSSLNAGMTLIELLVVLGIFIMIVSLTIFNYGSYRSSVSIQNLSNDIALSIRKAQSYAIGVANTTSSAQFSYGYGLHFSTVQDPPTPAHTGSNKAFLIFTDVSKDYMFQSTGSACSYTTVTATNECAEELSILTPDQVSTIYLNSSISSIIAGTAIAQPQGSSVDIVFLRPNPDAHFCYRKTPTFVNGDTCDQSSSISNVTIKIASMQNSNVRYITVWNTGQISAQ